MIKNKQTMFPQKATKGVIVAGNGEQFNLIDIWVSSDDENILSTSSIFIEIAMQDDISRTHILNELVRCSIFQIELLDRVVYITREKMQNIKINTKNHIQFTAQYCNLLLIRADNDDPSLWITE